MFRAHRGIIRNPVLIHRGSVRTVSSAHGTRALTQARIKGLRYAALSSTPATVRQAKFTSLIKVPASYRQRTPTRYKAVKF